MRLVLLLILAGLINLGLFVMMDRMIAGDSLRTANLVETRPIEFIRTPMDEETRTRDRRTPPPPKPQEIQRPRAAVQNIASRVSALPTGVASYEITSLLGEGGGVALGQTLLEGSVAALDVMLAEDLIPLTMLPPQYPPAARMRQVEGWVDLLFTVNADGSVSDPVVMAAEPADVFNEAAADAALRWRFRPVMRNGGAVETLAEIRINFSLESGR